MFAGTILYALFALCWSGTHFHTTSQFEKMDTVLSQLSLEDNDAVFLLTVNLCGDYQKQAFLAGVHVGMRLFTELQTEDCSLF